MDWNKFFNDFADKYYSVPDFTNEEHVYALQNYLIEQGMLTEDVDFADEESFKAKLDTLKESYFPKTIVEQSFDDEDGGTAQDIDTTNAMKSYMSAISRNKARAQ